ncbi:hypothetical protein GJ496_003748 [Pomphorhynchus laevis]|nr:hypothetical protein GJ496_003748 [Pomphorhynchus laevis]
MPRHDIHIWIGKDAPVDKLGSVAVYAIQLRREITNSDNIKQLPLVRRCQTFRHDEGSESNEFWQLFEHKISVKSGCLTASSMYTISKMEFCICSENCTGPICRQMYLINYVNGARQKGRLWALRVPVAQQYLQKQSSIMIRLKIKNQKKSPVILWFGKQVSDAKRAKVRLFIEQYCKEELIHEIVEIIDIFEGYEPKSFWLINFRNYDQNNYTRLVRRLESMSLSDIIYYTVLIRNCEIHLEQPDERKTCHSTIHQLSHNSVYIIDCWTTLYVWLGRQSNQIERNAAIKLCSELKSLLPRQVKDDTVISIQHDGLEDFVLRQILPKSQTNCINPGKGDGDSGGSSHQTIDTSAQNTGPGSNSQSAHLVLQDIFQPKFAIGHHQSTKLLNDCCNQTPDEQKLFASIVINAMELSSFREPRIMSKAEIGKFYSNACYVYIVNKFDHQQNCTTLVYFWKGRLVKTNKSWYIFNAHLKSRIQQLFGAFEMNKISQQQEPPEFRDLFVDQYMIIYLPDCQTKETRYFQISVHSKLSMTLEIEKIEALCPMCIYIVFAKLSKSAAVVYVWQSDRVNDADICTAEKIANTLFPNPEYAVQRIQQGCEPYDFFWQSIGGRKQVSTISLMPKRLFHCSNSKGYFEIKESYQKDFCQDSLLDGNVSFLDDGAGTLFVWISDTASQSLILRSVRAAQLYAGRQSPSGLSKQLSVKHDQLSAGDREIDVDLKTIRFIGTGKEPMEFRRCFFNWFCTEEQ